MNVLFIGNSYTHSYDMPKVLQKMTSSKGLNVNIEMDALSSHTFKMHSERKELFKHITQQKWDYVILQGFSRELSHPIDYVERETTPYLTKIIEAIQENKRDSKLVYFQTWGYKNGVDFMEGLNSFEAMSQAIENGYNHISKLTDATIVRVGRVWKSFKEDGQFDLYADDGQHPSGVGSYLIACVFLSKLFDVSPVEAYHPKSVSDKEAIYIQTFVEKELKKKYI